MLLGEGVNQRRLEDAAQYTAMVMTGESERLWGRMAFDLHI